MRGAQVDQVGDEPSRWRRSTRCRRAGASSSDQEVGRQRVEQFADQRARARVVGGGVSG